MKKRTVIKIILILLVLISVLVAAAILFLKSERGNEYIRSALVDFVEDLTRSKIEIGNLHTDLFSSITLKNITMFNSHGMVPDTLLNAGTVHVRYDISSLLFGEIGADSVLISNFKAYVKRNDKGEFNLPDFIFNSDEDTDSTIPFHIGHAELKDASFIYDDQFIPINASVRDLNFLLNLIPKDHLYEFGINLQTAKINYFDDPIELDGLSLTGHIKKDFKELSTEFRTAISDVNFSGSAIADMDSLYGKIIISGIPEKLVEVLAGTNTADLFSDTLYAELDYKLKNLLSEPKILWSLSVPDYKLAEIPIGNFLFTGKYHLDTLFVSELTSDILKGRISGEGWLANNSSLSHNLNISVNNIEMDQIFHDYVKDYYSSPLELTLRGNSSGDILPLEKLKFDSQLLINSDTLSILRSDISAENGNLNITSFNKSLADLNASLTYSKNNLKGSIILDMRSFAPVFSSLGYDGFESGLKLSTEIEGNLENLKTEVIVSSSGAEYKGNAFMDTLFASLSISDSLIKMHKGYIQGSIEELGSFYELTKAEDFGGGLNYTINGEGSPDKFNAELSAAFEEVYFNDINVKQGDVKININEQMTSFLDINIVTDSLSIIGNGELDLDESAGKIDLIFADENSHLNNVVSTEFKYFDENNFEAKILTENFDIGNTKIFLPNLEFSRGTVSFDLDFKIQNDEIMIHLPFSISELGLQNYTIDALTGKLHFEDMTAYIDSVVISAGDFKTILSSQIEVSRDSSGAFFIDENDKISGFFYGDSIELAILNSFLSDQLSAEGSADLNISWDGTLMDPGLTGDLNLQNCGLKFRNRDYLLSELTGRLNFSSNRINTENMNSLLNDTPININLDINKKDKASISADFNVIMNESPIIDLKGLLTEDSVNAAFKAVDLDLGMGKLFFNSFKEISGKLNSDIMLKSDYSSTEFEGEAIISEIFADPNTMNLVIKDGSIHTRLLSDRIIVDSSYLKLGRGMINLKGEANFLDNGLNSVNFNVAGHDISVAQKENFSLNIKNADIGVLSEGHDYIINGNIRFGESRILRELAVADLINMLESNTESVLESADKNVSAKPMDLLEMVEYEKFIQSALPASFREVKYNLNINNSDSIWIDNNVLNVRLSADIQVDGTVLAPMVSGRINLEENGKMYLLDREFDIRKIIVDFSDASRVNPLLEISADTEIAEEADLESEPVNYEIIMNITGPLDEFQFELISNPSLETSDIISLLSLGITYQKLQASENMNTILKDRSQVLATRSMSNQLDKFYNKWFGKYLGIDHIAISGNIFDKDRARLEFSKTWGNRFELTYSTSIKDVNKQILTGKYKINKYFFLEGETDQQEESGADLKFHLKFK